MDIELEKRVREYVDYLQQYAPDNIDFSQMDPVAKMMLVALLREGQEIRDLIGATPQRVVERYMADFIPRDKVGAMPAIALLAPEFKPHKDTGIVNVTSGASFTFKVQQSKTALNYLPVFETTLIPHSDLFLLTSNTMTWGQGRMGISMDKPNRLYLGIVTKVEVECLQGFSILVCGTGGRLPEHIVVGADPRELDFSTMHEMENITMLEPFDAQQASGQFFDIVNAWKESLLNMNDAALLYITDTRTDRDLFKPRPYPRVFQQWLEEETLDCFDKDTLWLRLDFPEGYQVPSTCQLRINMLPVTNVDLSSLTLTQASPIAKLQKSDGSFFLRVVETSTTSQKQGFNPTDEEIIIRDFDASSYHDGLLHRDVRTLYNRFIDDYYAFIDYNGIKDGEVLKQLRETINSLAKGVGTTNDRFKYDSGTFVMRNMSLDQHTSAIKVSFLTTMGRQGNLPQAGQMMENKKLPAIEQKIPIIVPAMGGTDKASVDERYELLRYYTLTNDRLYTRMDVDAFLRKELITEYGPEEFKRIFIRITIEGAAGDRALRRGLYVTIEFKDRKNYEHACQTSLDTLLRQRIENHSCIAMPIIVTLKNLEG